MSLNRQGKIHVSNLPNTTPKQHILEYLQTAGPIKEYNFDESGQRLSADVLYFDFESAETAKKYLDQKQLNTRKIKITFDCSREPKIEPNHALKSKLSSLRKEERTKLYRYLKLLRDQEGQMFVDFLDANSWLAQQLLKLRQQP